MQFKEHVKDVFAFTFRRLSLLRRFAAYGTQQAENDRLLNLIRHFSVDCILDVGANHGQFANDMRRCGFDGMIHSFEPLSACSEYLEVAAKDQPLWRVYDFALGDETGRRSFNVADNNGLSSSFLDGIDLDYGFGMQFTEAEEVPIKRLDDVVDDLALDAKCLLKLDTQGYEINVLEGGRSFIATHRPVIFLEGSLFPNYKGERLFGDLHALMGSLDYSLVLIRKQLGDTRVDLQADFAFLHEEDFRMLLDEMRDGRADLPLPASREQTLARAAE